MQDELLLLAVWSPPPAPRARLPPAPQTDVPGWLEAFAAHPRIGDVEGLKRKFGAFGSHSNEEQAAALAGHDDRVFQVRGVARRAARAGPGRDGVTGMRVARDPPPQELAECNRQYEQRFGHIFIVCASGKSAAEMLQALRERCEQPAAGAGSAAQVAPLSARRPPCAAAAAAAAAGCPTRCTTSWSTRRASR